MMISFVISDSTIIDFHFHENVNIYNRNCDDFNHFY